MAAPKINTYHCPCTSLLFASTHTLSSLPRRASPSLAQDIILPIADPSSSRPQSADKDSENNKLSKLGHTTLLSMTPDRQPTIIRRADGFEKRYLWRCGRCRLVVGYELDLSQYPRAKEMGDAMDVDGEKVEKVLYLLPGWIMSTEAMAAGKKIAEADVALGDGGKAIVAGYE
jgi:hypothetical protein